MRGPQVNERVVERSRERGRCTVAVTPRAWQGWDNTAEGAAALPVFPAPEAIQGSNATRSRVRAGEGWTPASSLQCLYAAVSPGAYTPTSL